MTVSHVKAGAISIARTTAPLILRRFIVHAKHRREPFERRFVDAIEATLEAWKLMAAGATSVYIFDDTAGKAYWPDDFVELFC